MKPYFCVILFSILLINSTFSQETDSIPNSRENALNIFLDCNYSCDMNFLKNNITMVNYVRDVKFADVYVRVVPQNTGSGGSEITLFFEGQNDFEEQVHKIIYTTEATSTSDERRIIMTKNLKAGLLPFIAQTPFFDQIEITYDEPEDQSEEVVEDKWNNWVYSIGVDGYLNGDSNYQGLYLYGNISARRVTEKWKISIGLNGNYNSDKFVIGYDENDNPEFFVSKTEGYGLYTYAIRGISKHWSAGGAYSLSTSTFSNIELGSNLAGAIEYNLFPYEESAERQLRFSYRPTYTFNAYADTTIYNKTEQHLARHQLGISYETQSKWGSVETSITGSQYFHDLDFYSVSLYAGLNIRIVKGLNLRLSGRVRFIRDQIALLKGGASEQEILTQQRELSTNYSYWGNFGINYSFGSIYNNVVFPRFGGRL